MNFTPGINKIKWQLVLIPLIAVTISVLLGVSQFSPRNEFQFPVQFFLFSGIYIFVIWEVNLLVYRKLDLEIPFFENPRRRLIKQGIFGFIATVGTFSAVNFLLSWLFESTFHFPTYLKYLVVSSVISFFINSLYIYRYLQKSIYYTLEKKTKELNELLQSLQHENSIELLTTVQPVQFKSILIKAGNKTIPIPFSDIAYFISGEGVVTLVKTDGQKLTTNYNSYSKISNRLPGQLFFQLNRQFITHFQSIRSVSDEKNRKLLVIISASKTSSVQESIIVSRYRNPEFKIWFSEKIPF